MDFNKATQEAINKIISEKMPEMIEAKVSEMINSIVKDVFSIYGDTAKSIKSKIEETINVNLQKFDLIDYNSLIAKTINDNLIQQINLQPILDMTQNIVGFVNEKTIRLEDIAEMFIEASKEENDQSGEGEITFIVEENEEHNWIVIYADIEPNTKEHNCSVKFIFSTKSPREGKIFSFKMKEKYTNHRQEYITPARMVNLGNIEAKIFRLYSAQVKITDYDYEPSQYWDRY